jgi:Ala-tRNA(Pro) deacylase
MAVDPRPRGDAYARLIDLLEEHQAQYRLIDHPPEGRTEIVSAFRGHDPRDAAKCMVLMIKLGKRTTRYVLAVVPGDARVDLAAVKSLFGATYVSFASPDIAEELAGSVPGTILPIPFDARLELIVDPALLHSPVLYFNAARLDRSLALRTDDFVSITAPRLAPIAQYASVDDGSSPPRTGDAPG